MSEEIYIIARLTDEIRPGLYAIGYILGAFASEEDAERVIKERYPCDDDVCITSVTLYGCAEEYGDE